jgi:tetratricopeptide (TPR) repeat protein
MNLNPDGLAAKIVIFKVLKSAKASNNWELVNEWVVKIDPKSLSTEPMMDMSGVRDWSDQSFWYNYRIRGLVETGNPNEAIALVDEISERYPKQRKLFLRLKARSYVILNNLTEAEAVYQNLCSAFKPDWWLLHEYSKVVRDIGRKEDALKLMYQAANSNSKLVVMVSLFEDIGTLCKKMEKNGEARAHLVLCKNVRYEKNWSIHESVLDNIDELNEIIGDNNEPNSTKEALNICRSYWKDLLGDEGVSKSRLRDKRKIRKSLLEKVSLGLIDRPFCFIITKDDESIFCFKSDLPSGIEDGGRVTFDAIPSFDRKKNKKIVEGIEYTEMNITEQLRFALL